MKECEQDETYPFARFNRKVEVIKYTDEEYQKVIAPLSSDWSKQETDHLFRLCEKYSLRFIVVADRFEQALEEEVIPERKRDSKHRDKENQKAKKQ